VREVRIEAGADLTKLDDYGTALHFIEEARLMFSAIRMRRRRLLAPVTR
jgi:hypothetical protein